MNKINETNKINEANKINETKAGPHYHREPLTSDLIFKAVFGQDTEDSKAALIGVLNLVLDKEKEPIRDLVYKNPFSLAETYKEKTIIMDIRAETSTGEQIDVEMQVEVTGAFPERMVRYGCEMAGKGLERGQKYDKMKKSIVISFIRGKMFSEDEPFHSVYTLREAVTGHELTKILELHVVELGKIPSGKPPAELTPLERFGAYLRCSGDPEQEQYVEALVRKGGEVITMTDKMLRKISEEERIREARIDRERYAYDVAMRELEAHERGVAEGMTAGVAQGRSEGAMLHTIQLVQKKWQNGQTAARIAEDLLEDPDMIERICDLVAQNPAASAEEIYKRLK